MVERFNAPVLKTGDPQGSVGSNPTPSATLISTTYVKTSEALERVNEAKALAERSEERW
jgi:hypothetical protein